MRMRRLYLAAALVAGAGSAAAQDLRSVEAHVHGHAEVAAALDDDRLLVTFSSPLANLTGFEHAPRDEAEQAVLDEVVATLQGGGIVAPNAEARCVLASAQVGELAFDAEGHGHEHDEDHAEAEHAGEHEDHAAAAHADIGVMYFFDCEAAEQLRSLALPLFDLYPGVAQVDATFLDDDEQLYRELTAGQSFDLHD